MDSSIRLECSGSERLSNMTAPHGDRIAPLGDTAEPLGDMGDLTVPLADLTVPIGDTALPLADMTVPLGDTTQLDDDRGDLRKRGRATIQRILVVDDHEDTARLMCQLLRKQKFMVRSAGSIRSAVDEVRREAIDLLISDITLPDGSGLDLMRRLGADKPLLGIAISGRGGEADVAASLAAGFARHLTKPIEFDELLGVIDALAEHKSRA
jgi:CheY-like chemotaxis protein